VFKKCFAVNFELESVKRLTTMYTRKVVKRILLFHLTLIKLVRKKNVQFMFVKN